MLVDSRLRMISTRKGVNYAPCHSTTRNIFHCSRSSDLSAFNFSLILFSSHVSLSRFNRSCDFVSSHSCQGFFHKRGVESRDVIVKIIPMIKLEFLLIGESRYGERIWMIKWHLGEVAIIVIIPWCPIHSALYLYVSRNPFVSDAMR